MGLKISIKNLNVTPLKKINLISNIKFNNIFPKEYNEKYLIFNLDNKLIGFFGRVYYKNDYLLKDYIVLSSDILNYSIIEDISEYCDQVAVSVFKNDINYKVIIKIGESNEYTFLSVRQFDQSMSLSAKFNKTSSIFEDTKDIKSYFKSNILRLI